MSNPSPKGPPARKSAPSRSNASGATSSKPKIDFAADATTKPVSGEALAEISKMADRVSEIKALLEEEEEYTRTLKEELYRIETVSLPESLKTVGLTEIRTSSGLIVKVVPFVQASIPAAGSIEKANGEEKAELEGRLSRCLSWIKNNNGESIIKSFLAINFGKGEAKKKETLKEQLQKKGLAVLDAETVHPQTLLSFIKEKLANGADIPFDDFKIYSGDKAEVKSAKK